MKKDDRLSYLFVGAGVIAFYALALPMLDSVSGWVQNNFSLKNVKIQAEAKKYQNQENQQSAEALHSNVVGFEIPFENEECVEVENSGKKN